MSYLDRKPHARSMPEEWHVAVHSDPAALETAWRQLEADGRCTVFQTFDWASCWYETARRTGQAEPVIVTVSRKGGELLWLLPLCLYRKQGLRFISFADLGSSDYAAPVFKFDPHQDEATTRAMIRAVRQALPPCDVIHLQKLPAEVEGAPNPLMSLTGLVRLRENAYGIRLQKPWEELAPEIMQSRLRSSARQSRKKIAKRGEVVLDHVDDPAKIRPELQTLMQMRRARFGQIGRDETPPDWERFYDAVATRADRTLGVSVTTLRVGGEPVASCFGLTRGTSYHVILPTFAMGEWSTYSPGTLLFDAMLHDFGKRTGNDGYFDFTIGDEPYKQRFGGTLMPLYEWMAPTSALGALGYLYWRAKVARRAPDGSG